MAVQEQTPYIEHIANGVTTSFALGFVCDSADNLVVTINDLPTNVGDWSFSDGNVVFQYPPLLDSLIKIWRNSPLARSTTFKTYDNSLNPNSLNFDLDKIWLVMQELNVKNSFSDIKLQELLDALVEGNINGLPAEVLARIAGDESTKSLVNLEAIRAYQAESNLSDRIDNESLIADQNILAEKNRAEAVEQNLLIQVNSVGVGNKAYKTYVLMDADKANIPAKSKVTVTNDATASNNGDWQWDGAVFTKSVYDPLTQAKADATTKANTAEANAKLYADQKTKNIDSNADSDTHQLIDDDFNVLARIDSEAQLFLVDLDNSVQVEINNQKKTASQGADVNSMLHIFSDDDDNIVAGIDIEGGLHLVGSTVSLQEKLNWREVHLPVREFHPRDLFTESVNKYILNMSVSGNQNAPIPFNLLPQDYTVVNSFINNYSLQPPTNYIPLDTPYGVNDRVVHPYVIEFSGNFRGYRYLMCITPYTQEYHENPVIMGSNNLQDWDMLTGFDQPIATPLPGRFLSDNGLTYDPINGMLICYWRDAFSEGSTDTKIWYRATRDGIAWSDATLLKGTDETSSQLSPSILFNPNDGLWHMWIGQESGYWRHYTAKNLNNNWTLKSTTPFLEKGIWHSEVKFLGDKYVMLINKRDPASNFYFAVSSDGDNWESGNYLFSIQQEALYKASFLPKFNDVGQLAFDIFYTTNHTTNTDWLRKFFHLTTNYAGI